MVDIDAAEKAANELACLKNAQPQVAGIAAPGMSGVIDTAVANIPE